ncbi:hypothetical protein TIFTF001_056285 [Ficus carica]|uniref:Uncharacterized protein n=1 Tax=Ficus carica TaxID=3494 RepID=A0AA88EHV8_FICCA|nr:hypothetical protein TIFTF001_056285 [Ficus carica]
MGLASFARCRRILSLAAGGSPALGGGNGGMVGGVGELPLFQ